MKLSADSRAARKKAQLARISTKTQPGYPALYASQPVQVEKANIDRTARQLARGIKNQAETAARAAAESAAIHFSGVVLTDGKSAGKAK